MLWGGDWLYLADLTALSKTHTLNLKNPLYYFPHPCGGGLRGRVSPIIAKPCDSKTKQSKKIKKRRHNEQSEVSKNTQI